MNKLIALLFLVLAVAALTTDDAHAQAARPAQYAQNPTPAQQPRGQPQQYNPTNKFKRVGFEAEIGDPFGNEAAIKRTCFQPPCFEPTTGCASPRKWNPIFYLVPTVNGQKGRFLGYECKWNDKDLSDNHSTIIAYILISKPLITITEK